MTDVDEVGRGSGSEPDLAPSPSTAGLVVPIVLLAVLAVLAAASAVGRSAGRECTLVGCASLARVDLESVPDAARAGATAATICVDGACRTDPVAAGQPFVVGDLPGLVAGSVSVVLLDAGGAELARYESTGPLTATVSYPNGPDCDPPCPSLKVAVVDGVLVQQP